MINREMASSPFRDPRFHVGESLLPANLPLFERLGVGEAVRAIGIEKWGAEFVSPWHEKGSQTFHFADAWDKTLPYSYEVRRADLDEILFRNAAKRGATTVEGCRVRDIVFLKGEGALVHAEHDDGHEEDIRARFVVDASGRDTFLANRFRDKERNPRHNSSALYAHFRGARRGEGQAEGNISIFWFDHGWFWFIPLTDNITSVGAVMWPYFLKARDKPVEDFFRDTLARCPALMERLAEAELVSGVEATGNFSYNCSRSSGPGYVRLGDAFAFIDPVFSSGVMLAMNGGFLAADAIATCLDTPEKADAALRHYDRKLRLGPQKFSWFIYRINHPSMRDLFMDPHNIFRVKEALLSMLAGDIFGDTPIWRSLGAFKMLYYLHVLSNPRRSFRAWRRRRDQIRVVEELPASVSP
ncbi:MAG TPA: tryptophan 7-halogenase [Acidiferrobacter sp.]|nr:tryptophan 7-halogenase [Acidiferrobacter sp.]